MSSGKDGVFGENTSTQQEIISKDGGSSSKQSKFTLKQIEKDNEEEKEDKQGDNMQFEDP